MSTSTQRKNLGKSNRLKIKRPRIVFTNEAFAFKSFLSFDLFYCIASGLTITEIPRRNDFAIIFAQTGWGFWQNFSKV